MKELDVTFIRAAQVWWAFSWRAMLFSLLVGALIGVVVGFITVSFGIDPKSLMPFNLISGGLIGVLVSIWVLSKILNKKFSNYRIALVLNE